MRSSLHSLMPAELSNLFAGVHKRVAFRHRQNAMDLDMLVKQFQRLVSSSLVSGLSVRTALKVTRLMTEQSRS